MPKRKTKHKPDDLRTLTRMIRYGVNPNAAPDMLAILAEIDDEYGNAFEGDDDINGGDLVDFMGQVFPRLWKALNKARKR